MDNSQRGNDPLQNIEHPGSADPNAELIPGPFPRPINGRKPNGVAQLVPGLHRPEDQRQGKNEVKRPPYERSGEMGRHVVPGKYVRMTIDDGMAGCRFLFHIPGFWFFRRWF